MKPPKRTPLNLTDLELPSPDEPRATAGKTALDSKADAEPTVDSNAQPQRPMSERRRRRLAEERRLSAERAAEPPPPAAESGAAPAVTPEFAESADAPPVAWDPPSMPSASASSVLASDLPAPASRSAYVIAGAGSVLWIGGVASMLAYEVGSGVVELEPLRLAIYALIALAPTGLAIMLAHAVRQGTTIAGETRRARELAQALVAPTALAAQQAGEVLTTLRQDIDQASLATERARSEMTLLREALAEETTRLNEAAETAGRTARRLAEQLGREREGMQTLGLQLDTQAASVLDAVERQSRMVIDASDLAQTQLREAEAALAARAADLAAAAGEAQDAARIAADDLARQTLRLENAGTGVSEQIQSVEAGLGQQRAALVTAAYALRTDQEDFSAQVESQRAQLIEQLSAARAAAADLGQTSTSSTDALKELVDAATDQFRALVDMSQREADGFDNATKVALDRFEAMAAEARDNLVEETRRALAALQATAEDSRLAASGAADQAQVRADRLGEALFDAAQKADQAADARIEGARRLVGETAGLVDEAGERALERLEATVERMNTTFSRMEDAIGELDNRASDLPAQAQQRIDAVRTSVEEGLAALSAASRKAAEDTEALDAGFQERVRRNYEMLTEAVRLMGVVSGDTPAPRRREPEPAEEPKSGDSPRARPPRAEEGRGFGLRGRLKLEPAGKTPPPTPTDDRLDWSDLENSDADESPLDLDTPIMPEAKGTDQTEAQLDILTERIIAAIRRMGVDPNALLPRSRVEESGQAIADRDPDRARQIVRRVAPAAVRSVSRRVLSDSELRDDAEQFVHGFGQRLRARTGDGAAVLALLTSDGGRAFMLLDAAIGDLG
ncbi:tipN [uncultured Brevundimonas sp.]|uniref:tipN n=1 Tax=uncultured Brevundimonas sp. TaxID=213418 RepID=UPI0030EF7D43|tara:strand:+ start:63084 stop:65651 length:2568 start_codon:yes stop_codon:yes gene_type:complete